MEDKKDGISILIAGIPLIMLLAPYVYGELKARLWVEGVIGKS